MAIVHITKENYQELVVRSEKPVLLDFWATWCGPCRMIVPILEEIASEREDIVIGKIDVDQEMELAMEYKIVSIPTLILVQNGLMVDKLVGYRPKSDILDFLE